MGSGPGWAHHDLMSIENRKPNKTKKKRGPMYVCSLVAEKQGQFLNVMNRSTEIKEY